MEQLGIRERAARSGGSFRVLRLSFSYWLYEMLQAHIHTTSESRKLMVNEREEEIAHKKFSLSHSHQGSELELRFFSRRALELSTVCLEIQLVLSRPKRIWIAKKLCKRRLWRKKYEKSRELSFHDKFHTILFRFVLARKILAAFLSSSLSHNIMNISGNRLHWTSHQAQIVSETRQTLSAVSFSLLQLLCRSHVTEILYFSTASRQPSVFVPPAGARCVYVVSI